VVSEENWAGSWTYHAPVVRPRSRDELAELVTGHRRVRALGSRHSFTDLPDTDPDGVLLSLEALPVEPVVDEERRTVTVGGAARFAALGEELDRQGWALPTMASLPHISVAGAVATGTHGSGRQVPSLAALVRGLEVVGADGATYTLGADDPDLAGSVVALGALGIVTAVTLDVVPTFDLRQEVWLDLPWPTSTEALDAVLECGYSVSLFTSWRREAIEQVWVKSRAEADRPDLSPARAAEQTVHMIAGADTAAVTEQLGAVGPWHHRLPHFRASHTPSAGEELQSEYFVPADRALEALTALRTLGDRLAPLLLVSEVRTIAGDDLWLSGAYGGVVVAFHFTWRRDWDGVQAVLPLVEELLLPLGARPHWGKVFTATREDLAAAYPELERFRALRARRDPEGRFGNAFLDRLL
jgi:alditol oxidase